MHTLRTAKLVTCLVLVWFALFVGASIASPMVGAGNLQMVCSGDGGMKMVDSGDDEGAVKPSARMDCPLCVSVAPPPPADASPAVLASPLAHAMQPVAAAHIASATAPPLPSRGPPVTRL
jgi:hypothetical protein